jgi:hypothetical protein
MVRSSTATSRSSGACISPSQVSVEAKDEQSSCSYRFPLLRPSCLPYECKKMLNLILRLNTIYDITLILSIICVYLDPGEHMRCIWFLFGNQVRQPPSLVTKN